MAAVETRLAQADDLDAVAALFDGYRQFYGRAPDLAGATDFIGERLGRGDSMIIVAVAADRVIGFAQLYPSFTSVGMDRLMILNDLFVDPGHRKLGAARALLAAATEWAEHAGAVRMTLKTQTGNLAAQRLYESTGWVRDDQFHTYNLRLKA